MRIGLVGWVVAGIMLAPHAAAVAEERPPHEVLVVNTQDGSASRVDSRR